MAFDKKNTGGIWIKEGTSKAGKPYRFLSVEITTEDGRTTHWTGNKDEKKTPGDKRPDYYLKPSDYKPGTAKTETKSNEPNL